MRLFSTILLTLALAATAGCAAGGANEEAPQAASTSGVMSEPRPAAGGGDGDAAMKTVSLQQTEDATPTRQQPPQTDAPAAVQRKIIRNATLTLEADEPAQAAQRVASVAESRGGFVVTSESRQQTGSKGGRGYETFTVELRVPAQQFDAALADIRAAAGSVTAQKISGKDVTEEYIDLEARLRTQRALETQMLEIMARADTVADAVAVQRELANVRTEIERLEGRRRFLENQSSLSTISVTIQPPAPLLNTTGFFSSVGKAFGEGIDIAATVTLFLIRVVLALLPVVLFLGVPAYFILRYIFRRMSRRAPVARPQPTPAQEFPPPPPSA